MSGIPFKHIAAVTLTLLPSLATLAQVEWLEEEYDFGTWREAEGPRQGFARFVNRGSEAVTIRRVRPSCGCTNVDWPETPIAPGDTATVRFSYNPAGRPGKFGKTVKVYLSDSDTPKFIRITGTVIGTVNSLADKYPVAVGQMRLSERTVDFGDVVHGKSKHTYISAYNASEQPMQITLRANSGEEYPMPDYVTMTPGTVPPGQVQTISVYLNTAQAETLGPLQSTYTYCAGDDCTELTVKVNIVPDRSKYPGGDLSLAPQADTRPDILEIGEVKRGKTARLTFEVRNTGKSDLHISRVYSPCKALSVTKMPQRIAPGKKQKVSVEIDTDKISSDIITGEIMVVSDDPLMPVRKVRFAGKMK